MRCTHYRGRVSPSGRLTVEVAGKHSTIIAGAGFGYAQAVEMTRIATQSGAHGVLALPPYYPNAPKSSLFDYYQAIGEQTNLGMLVYSRDWVKLSPEDAETLANRIPNLVAWKDGQGDTRATGIIDRLGDRFHWIGGIGDDCVPAYYSIGIRTYTSASQQSHQKSRFCCMSMQPVVIPKLSQSW